MDLAPRRVVSVTAPSRLHFGLFAFGGEGDLQFGGVGVMIDRPKTRLRFAHSARLDLPVEIQGRLRRTIATWLTIHSAKLADEISEIDDLPVSIRQISGPESHVGLGSGTQLALSVAPGLNRWFQIPTVMNPTDAINYGRARRSAVGSHGFFLGGLIVEQGKFHSESLGTLDVRIELPDEWRVVLACPRGTTGPFGHLEESLFESLPPVDPKQAMFLRNLVGEQLVPAAQAGDFSGFCDALYTFGYRAGLCYESIQSGPFHGPEVRRIVEFIRSSGVNGVGQSSWGPCVFALCRSNQDATRLATELSEAFPQDRFWIEVASINRNGYSVSECRTPPITIDVPTHRH